MPGHFRWVSGAQIDPTQVPLDKVVIAGVEAEAIVKRLHANAEGQTPPAKPPNLLSLHEPALMRWAAFPWRLGRQSLGLINRETLHLHREPAPLLDQLRALRQRKPGRRHFRFLLVNGLATLHPSDVATQHGC